jgi:hypothetical protein
MSEIRHEIAAVLAALRFRDPDPSALRFLDDSSWKDLLSYCDLMHLTLPLATACDEGAPAWVRTRVHMDLSHNALRFERIKATYSELAGALKTAGVEHIVLKGFAQWPDYAEDPRIRLQSDIDLFCQPDAIEHARDALVELGYKPSSVSGPSDHLPNMNCDTGWRWRGDFYDPDMPPSVELHYRFWDRARARFGPQRLDEFWTRRAVRRVDHLSFPALHWVDNLGFSALQVLRDLLFRNLLTHKVYELARFLHRNAHNPSFWREWLNLHDDSLRSCEAVAFRLAVEWFACDVSCEVQDEIDRLPAAVEKWFGNCASSSLNVFSATSYDPLWLHWILVGTRRDRCAILIQTIRPNSTPTLDDVTLRDTTPDGRPQRRWFSSRLFRYLAYCLSRVVYRVRALGITLWRGACYWWSIKSQTVGS